MREGKKNGQHALSRSAKGMSEKGGKDWVGMGDYLNYAKSITITFPNVHTPPVVNLCTGERERKKEKKPT